MRIGARVIAGVALVATVVVGGALSSGAADGPLDIDVVLPLSGNSAFLGKTEERALLLLEKLVNEEGVHGRQIKLVMHDDESSPQTAVQITSGIVARNPALMLGSTLAGTCNAMAPLVQKGPVMYCFSPGIHPPAGSYVYTANVSTVDLADALIRYFRMRGWMRIALITSSDATGQDADRGVAEVVGRPDNQAVKLVARQHFNPADVSAAAQIADIKAADPQALIIWTTGSPLATVLRAMQQVGLDVPVGTTSGNMTHAQMTQFAAFLPKYLYIPSSEWPVSATPGIPLPPAVQDKQKAFRAAFKAAGVEADEGAGLSWDPMLVLIDSLRALPAGATAAQLNDHLQHLTDQPGINGVYNYVKTPQRGLNIDDTIVTRWNAGTGHWEPVAKPTGIPLQQ